MKILICNERFLFRFGVDRALIILGNALKEFGYQVSIMGNNYDLEVVEKFADKIIKTPVEDGKYLDLNEFTQNWLENNWDNYFDRNSTPDIVFVGGWPFFSSIPFFKQKCKNVIFLDCGAVPLNGFTGGALITQNKLRKLRKDFLNEATQIIGISDFIVQSQSILDARNIPVKTILLGADHMDKQIWPKMENNSNNTIEVINEIKEANKKVIFCLGRWEPGCYKNSESAYSIMTEILKHYSDCVLLILTERNIQGIPKELQTSIIPIGFPSDEELQNIMRLSDIGISLSLWEGFNLPLAEMQWLGKPVLVFDVAAHPEVIQHPWFLCKNEQDMVQKAISIFMGKGLTESKFSEAQKKFHEHFSWKRFTNEVHEMFIKCVTNSTCILIDVTNAAKDTANSGVIRVTRRIGQELQKFIDPIFVLWDSMENTFVFPTINEYRQLGEFNGPILTDHERVSNDTVRTKIDNYLIRNDKNSKWLIFTETVNEMSAAKIRSYARKNNIKLGAIFYDAIPVLHPEFCNSEVTDNHSNYMKGLSKCDIVIPISNFSSQCLQNYWDSNKISGCEIKTNLLPGEFGGYDRQTNIIKSTSNTKKILCVSTLEPRKNHIKLINSCLLIQKKYPELKWELILVGNRYAGNSEIPDFVNAISEEYSNIKWLGVVNDETLHQLYNQANFTIYPSLIEGFGMPIMESLWHGKPCICSNGGVMAELAKEGGCFTVNVADENDLAEAIHQLATNEDMYNRLLQEAISRDIKSWREYTILLLDYLSSCRTDGSRAIIKDQQTKNTHDLNWDDVLFPSCICEGWQMNISERTALTALLAKHKPRCSIEIGTYKGGSLSLISQYSQLVFSIDIDPSIPEKFKQFGNVVFLTGPSNEIMPILLEELDKANIPVDFILIDGDHSADGIRKDINNLYHYIPKKPLFVMLHDSFNPECRKGMMEGQWDKSPYLYWIDLDFVPGRLVEHGGGGQGEMWGGLGLAYYKTEKREHDIVIGRSANNMFEMLRRSL